jgi:hypothetical protein
MNGSARWGYHLSDILLGINGRDLACRELWGKFLPQVILFVQDGTTPERISG